jgi:metalloendopeptidase OMA1, mitochondrial
MRVIRWPLLLYLAAFVPTVLGGCETAPVTGRSQLQLVSPAEETQMGTEAYKEILSKAKISNDPTTNPLVKRVGTRIATATGRTDLPWEFTVIDDVKTVNAFALPGGKVAVYTGILPITRDEAGLAAVLGHEIAHVTARHSAERMSKELAVQIGAQTFGAFVGLSPDLTKAGAAILVNGLMLPWGRDQESEADHIGLIYMAKGGYNPEAARDLWIRMAEASKGQSRPPEFLSTHPSDETRVRQIEGWLPEAKQSYQPPK